MRANRPIMLMSGQKKETEGGFSYPPIGSLEISLSLGNGGQECPPSVRWKRRKCGLLMSKQRKETEGGFSCPPSVGLVSVEYPFLDPYSEIEQHEHRLPHWQQGNVYYFVTWRMADAIPQRKLEQLRQEKKSWLRNNPEPWDTGTEEEYHTKFTHRVDQWLDAGSGSCVLRDPKFAEIVAKAFRFFDGARYDMASFVVMPNHVHTLFQLRGEHRLQNIVKSWKGYTAREINKRLSEKGTFWQEDYWDRMIRNERHFAKCWDYIHINPLNARLGAHEYVYYAKEADFSNLSNGGLESPPSVEEF